jgi:tetratricopeptide (TPR) repeat protein
MSDDRNEGAQQQPSEPAPYKLTLFDRHGPDAALLIRAWMYGLATCALFLPLAALALKKGPLAFLGSVAAGGFALKIGLSTSSGAGKLFARFTMGSDTTPYKEQYSREQALVMRGEVDEALRSFEAIIAENPNAVDPRFKAAELYAKERGEYRRAAELFREVQRIEPRTSGEDIYATNRLVDLYTGPLSDPGRALVELRRLIERHPQSPAATHARTALAALKSRVHSES